MSMTTSKTITQTKHSNGGNCWLKAVQPEGFVEIAATDANAEGEWDFGNGQRRTMIGLAKVIQGMRPGTQAFP